MTDALVSISIHIIGGYVGGWLVAVLIGRSSERSDTADARRDASA